MSLNLYSNPQFAAVQGKKRSIVFFLRNPDGALSYGVSSAYGAETKDTKYTFDVVTLPPGKLIYPSIPRISAVSWDTPDGKEEVRVYYATGTPDKPQLTEIGQSGGGSWFTTNMLDSNPVNLNTTSPICASKEWSTEILKVYFWRPSGKFAVCWSAIPGTKAAKTYGSEWRDQDIPVPTPASPKL